MFVNPFEIPRNPVELSALRAEEVTSQSLEAPTSEERLLSELDYAAHNLDFFNRRYFMEVGRAVLIPVGWNSDEPFKIVDFPGLTFEGEFVSFSRVAVGRVFGSPRTVRALCLTINNALLLPYFDRVEDDALLYVPVLSVNSIQAA